MEVTKIFRFEAAHSVADAYTAKCDRLRGGIHGHSYVLELTMGGEIKQDGMVMDFSLVKQHFNHIIDAFDHSFIINSDDRVMVALAPLISARYIIFPNNPTAENMAEYFFNYINNIIGINEEPCDYLKQITVWETITGKATRTNAVGGGNTPYPLFISPAICEGWNEYEHRVFKANDGTILAERRMIKSIDVGADLGDTEENSLILSATLNDNCK